MISETVGEEVYNRSTRRRLLVGMSVQGRRKIGIPKGRWVDRARDDIRDCRGGSVQPIYTEASIDCYKSATNMKGKTKKKCEITV